MTHDMKSGEDIHSFSTQYKRIRWVVSKNHKNVGPVFDDTFLLK